MSKTPNHIIHVVCYLEAKRMKEKKSEFNKCVTEHTKISTLMVMPVADLIFT